MTPDTWTEMAGAFALGTLDPDDRRAFEERLHVDPELQVLVAEYREALGVVSDALPPAAPPHGLRSRILDRARSLRSPNASTIADRPEETEASLRSDRPIDPNARGTSTGWRFATAAAVLLSLGLGAWAMQLRERSAGLEQQVVTLTGELGQIRGELGQAEVDLARYDSIASALVGTDLRFATLQAPETDPRMHLVFNPEQDVVLIAAVNLAPAPPGRIYQLWGIREGEDPVSLGTFDSGADNVALQALAVPADQEFDLSAVSEEPTGGSPQPTTTPFLAGAWSPQGS